MITESDSFSTIDLGAYFAILPSDGRLQQVYRINLFLPQPFRPVYATTGLITSSLDGKPLKSLIRQHVDSSFQPV